MLIGLTGRAGAGKDTVYETLAEIGPSVERRSFADALYTSAAAALGVTRGDLRAWKRNPNVQVCVVVRGELSMRACQSVRQYLQRYGTEAHRDVFGEDFWIAAVPLGDHEGRLVVVTDVRFPNEARAVREAGGVVVEVIGPDDGAPEHASERGLPPDMVDYLLPNTRHDDDRASLRVRLSSLVARLRHEGAR